MQSRSDNLNWRVRGPHKQYETPWGIHIQSGKQTIKNIHVNPVKHNFNGYCFICKNSKHSQLYCPLSRCSKCKQYGHTEKNCSFQFIDE